MWQNIPVIFWNVNVSFIWSLCGTKVYVIYNELHRVISNYTSPYSSLVRDQYTAKLTGWQWSQNETHFDYGGVVNYSGFCGVFWTSFKHGQQDLILRSTLTFLTGLQLPRSWCCFQTKHCPIYGVTSFDFGIAQRELSYYHPTIIDIDMTRYSR